MIWMSLAVWVVLDILVLYTHSVFAVLFIESKSMKFNEWPGFSPSFLVLSELLTAFGNLFCWLKKPHTTNISPVFSLALRRTMTAFAMNCCLVMSQLLLSGSDCCCRTELRVYFNSIVILVCIGSYPFIKGRMRQWMLRLCGWEYFRSVRESKVPGSLKNFEVLPLLN